MDQIQAMRIFTRVVEAGTFTRAADSLSLPKATVTKHVQALEERLRVKLLNRTTRRVTVTADGAAYYERTVRLLSDLDDIEASMTNARASPMGRLRVDVGTSVAQLLIIPHLADFQTRFPDIQLDLGVSDRTVDPDWRQRGLRDPRGRAERPVTGGTAHWQSGIHHRGIDRLPCAQRHAAASAGAGRKAHQPAVFFTPVWPPLPAGVPQRCRVHRHQRPLPNERE